MKFQISNFEAGTRNYLSANLRADSRLDGADGGGLHDKNGAAAMEGASLKVRISNFEI